MSDPTPYPTLPHALAAMDELPIAGAMQISADHPGVDYDALDRARKLLPYVWSDEVGVERIGMTPQGGVTIIWRRADAKVELTVDPFALFACRVETKSKLVDWTRATLEQAVPDVRAALGLPPLAAAAAAKPARPRPSRQTTFM
jgi:hypothetical protein